MYTLFIRFARPYPCYLPKWPGQEKKRMKYNKENKQTKSKTNDKSKTKQKRRKKNPNKN